MIDTDDVKNRIAQLKKMKKDELISLVLDVETNNHILFEENKGLKQKNDELIEERNAALLEKDEYREKYNHYFDKYHDLLGRKSVPVKVHNERGAGRKNKFTDEQIEQIKEARASGKSIRVISEEFDCSVGLVHKLINEHK